MPSCPSCQAEIRGKDIADKTSLQPYRTCPVCQSRFTADAPTKKRQAIALVLAIASLTLTIGWCFFDQAWQTPTITSYIVLAACIFWGNRRVQYVSYP